MNDRISEGEGDQMIVDTKEKFPGVGSAQNSPQQNPSVESDQAANNHRDSGLRKLHISNYLKGGCKSKTTSTDDRQSKNKSRDKDVNHP